MRNLRIAKSDLQIYCRIRLEGPLHKVNTELWPSGKSSEHTLQKPVSIFLKICCHISVSYYVLYCNMINISLFIEPGHGQ